MRVSVGWDSVPSSQQRPDFALVRVNRCITWDFSESVAEPC